MGRKPVGPKLADRVQGSPEAKQRLKVCLETITGEKTMEEACKALGLHKSMLFQLREQALQAAAESLEAKRIGRPPLEAAGEASQRIAELEAENRRLQTELKAAEVRSEVTLALRSGGMPPAQKKTNRRAKRPSPRLRNPCHSPRPRTSKLPWRRSRCPAAIRVGLARRSAWGACGPA